MSEYKHNIGDLCQMQSLPLHSKIRMTEQRIEGWIDEFGEDGVYIAFSGGKDSTVLLDIIRNRMGYKNIPAVFVDVPTQFIELREFVKTWKDVEIIKPKISFMDICEKYGFPLISKEVALKVVRIHKNPETSTYWKYFDGSVKGKSVFDCSKYRFIIDAPFNISHQCCEEMKHKPSFEYGNKTHRKPIVATMADESKSRTKTWLQHGCNAFEAKRKISAPISFWTEQDILTYIHTYSIPICSVYGKVVENYEAEGLLDGQVTFDDFKCDKIYKTTGCNRTGCALCGFGCHLGNSRYRFAELRETHPKMYNLLDVVKNNGVTFREAIEWTNEHGNLDIKL